MRATESKLRSPTMNETQVTCFRLYVELGDGRSIPALYKQTVAREMSVSLRQLLRWSAQFGWTQQAQKTAAVVAENLGEAMLEGSVEWNRKQIIALRTMQARFIENVDNFEPDFRDFQDAAKLERLILGDPTERRETAKPSSRLVVEVGEAELLDAARAIAAKRYGLPTDEQLAALRARAEADTLEHEAPE